MKLPFSAQSVSEFLERTRESFAISAPASSVGFEAIGREWQALGVQPGDLVLLCLSNGLVLLEQFFSVLAVGAVPALVTPNMPSARLREMIQVMGVRAIVGERLPHADLKSAQRETVAGLDVALFTRTDTSLTNPGEVVLLTSGTSGFASGCVFDLESLLLNAERHADAIGQRSDDVVLVNLPLYFSFALVAQALATFVRGGVLVIGGPPFHVPTYEQTLARFSVTVSSLTPILVRSLLRQEGAFGANPRVLTVGGDALAPMDVARLLAARPGGELYLTYGLTQAGPRVSTLAAHDEPPERYTSVGKPLAGTVVALRAVEGHPDCKQLWISSATVMKRTLGVVEGRSDLPHLRPGTVATGDIFEQDALGYLYFVSRLTDYFIRNGEKISLVAVRRVAAQLPAVINARTRVIRQADGKEDFELTLHVSDGSGTTVQDYVRMLHQWLRRAEMPGNVSLVTDGEPGAASHK